MSGYSSSHVKASGATLTAFFDRRADAEAATVRLRELGLPQDSVRLAGEYESGSEAPPSTREKGFFEALGDLFMPDDDRHTYAEAFLEVATS